MRRGSPWVVAIALACVASTIPLDAAAAPPADCKKVEQKKRKGGRVAQLLAVAKCHHDNGQFTAAWYEYTEAAQRARDAKDKKSLKVAQKGEQENAGLLAWVTVNADKDSQLDVDGERTVSGAKKALDPGKHTITAKGGHRSTPWTKTLDLKSGDVEEVAVPAPVYDPSAPLETPVPGSPSSSSSKPAVASSPSATATASAGTTPGADKHEDSSSDEEEEEEEPHTGFAADVDALVTLYDEASATSQDTRNGQTYAFMGHVAYDFTPEIRAFIRLGFVDNYAPGRAHAASLSNLALGGSYGLDIAPFLRVAAEGGLLLPTGTGGGTDPAEGIAIANARARTLPLHPAMFDPNYFTPYVGLIATTHYRRIVGRLDWFLDPSMKINDADDEPMKTRMRLTAHGGYRVLTWLEPFLEARYYRVLSSTPAIDQDSTLADNLFGGVGVAATLAILRAQVAYLRALDPPLSRFDFNVFAIRVGAEF